MTEGLDAVAIQRDYVTRQYHMQVIEALRAERNAAEEDARIAESEKAAWEKHGQEETFAREAAQRERDNLNDNLARVQRHLQHAVSEANWLERIRKVAHDQLAELLDATTDMPEDTNLMVIRADLKAVVALLGERS